MGRIGIIFNKSEIKVDVLVTHSQYIHCNIVKGKISFKYTVVYGSYVFAHRIELWNSPQILSSNIIESWMVLGDFNAVISNSDRIGGVRMDDQAADEFKSWVNDANLFELKKNRKALYLDQ